MIISGRLDTGMTAQEAVERGSSWWDSTGRHHLPKEFNQETTVKAKGPVKGFPSIVIRNNESVVPSGILHGSPWDELNQDEQRQVIKAWHHFFVRLPIQNDEAPPATVDQVLTIRCDSALHPKATRDTPAVFRGRTQVLCCTQAQQRGWLISAEKDICPECYTRAYHDEPRNMQ